MACKIAVIGAGGACFVTGFVKDICESKYLQGCTLSLMDINEVRLQEAKGVAERYRDEIGASVQVEATTDRKKALENADYVVLTALVMGNDKYQDIIKTGLAHGYKFGGSLHIMHDEAFPINFYQLRLMEEIAKDVLAICPNAYFITTSNPVQAGITYLGRKYPALKAVGMCPGFSCFYFYTDEMGLDRKKVEYDFAGVNHFIWLTKFTYDKQDGMPILNAFIEKERKERGSVRKIFDVYERLGLLPIGDTAEVGGGCWGWQYHVDKKTEEKYFEDPTFIWNDYFDRCEEAIAFRKRIVEDETLRLSDEIKKMMPDWTIELIESLEADLGKTLVVNVMNDKEYTKGLPTDYQTEIKAIVDKKGIHPIPNEGLPKQIQAILYRDRIAPVEMELKAFETGDKRFLKELIMMDPWTKTEEQAQALLNELLNKPWNKAMKAYFE